MVRSSGRYFFLNYGYFYDETTGASDMRPWLSMLGPGGSYAWPALGYDHRPFEIRYSPGDSYGFESENLEADAIMIFVR